MLPPPQGLYLGVLFGEAEPDVWGKATKKFVERTGSVLLEARGIKSRAAVHKQRATVVLTYLLQFREPSVFLLREFKDAIRG